MARSSPSTGEVPRIRRPCWGPITFGQLLTAKSTSSWSRLLVSGRSAMRRHVCFLLAIPLAFIVFPPVYAQRSSGAGHGGGHSSSAGFSGHSVGHSVGHSFGRRFGHRPGKGSSQPRSRGGELPPLAGAALIHGKVVILPSPRSSMALDGQLRQTARGQFATAFAPHKLFRANPFDAGFCDSFRFTWHGFLFPDDFNCFGNPFLSHRLFSRTF